MAHRPPKHPLPRGLVWRHFTVGMGAGLPLAEWAYVTPEHPDGIRISDLQTATELEQEETAKFWFLSNYEPFINDGRWFGFGPGNAGFGQGSFAPPHWPPMSVLETEFYDVPPETVLGSLAAELELQATSWMQIPYRSPAWRLNPDGGSTKDEVLEALARLEESVRAISSAQGGIGHNQGPPLLDKNGQDEIKGRIEAARTGVQQGAAGVVAVNDAKIKLQKIWTTVGLGLIGGFSSKAGADVYSPTKHLLIQLFHSLGEVVVMLGHWLTTLPWEGL